MGSAVSTGWWVGRMKLNQVAVEPRCVAVSAAAAMASSLSPSSSATSLTCTADPSPRRAAGHRTRPTAWPAQRRARAAGPGRPHPGRRRPGRSRGGSAPGASSTRHPGPARRGGVQLVDPREEARSRVIASAWAEAGVRTRSRSPAARGWCRPRSGTRTPGVRGRVCDRSAPARRSCSRTWPVRRCRRSPDLVQLLGHPGVQPGRKCSMVMSAKGGSRTAGRWR